MSFPAKLFSIKRNLVFMNNLYHRVAVASVCTALGFALGANKEAKAATFSSDYYLYPFSTLTFQAIDGGSYGSFDGQGDTVTNVSYHNNGESIQPHSWHDAIERTDSREVAALLESPFSSMTGILLVIVKMPKLQALLMQFCRFMFRIGNPITTLLLWVSSAM